MLLTEMDILDLTLSLHTWGYAGLLGLLLLTGVGSPIPEDLLLLTAGYLVFAEVFDWPLTFVTSGVGVVASDVLLYLAGRHIAWRSERRGATGVLSPERVRLGTRWFARWGEPLVLVARCVPGTRVLVFVTAGMRPVSIGRFLRYDILGAVIWVSLMLALGYGAGGQVGDLGEAIDLLKRVGAIGFFAVCALFAAWLTLGREESKL